MPRQRGGKVCSKPSTLTDLFGVQMKPDQINWTSISITWLRRWIHARARRVPVRDLMFVYTAYIGTGCWQFHPCERSSRTMHPGQNNSLGPLWSVRDKSFIIDLRLIVTLWITRVCTVWYALAYTPAFSYRLASVCRFSLSLSSSSTFYFLRLYKQQRIPFSHSMNSIYCSFASEC